MDEKDVIRSLVCLSLLVATQLSATTVYRTVDEKGNVQYSDRPDREDTQALTIRTPRPATPAATRTAAASPAPASGADDPAESAQGPTEAQLAEQAALTAERRAKNCATARGRVERYAISHRLYRSLPNGEREYLSDAEIDEARVRAEADVQEWCD
jgi:hypothetical protein